MQHTFVTTPSGEELVLVSRADFERVQELFDAVSHRRTMEAITRGEQEVLTAEEVREALSAASPLAFWRRKRGLTQKTLSGQVAASQSYLADLEAGRRKGDPALIKRLAKALNVRMEDLVVDASVENPE
jgi:ribosome-binding protein aMBF1 (putative translation factor)